MEKLQAMNFELHTSDFDPCPGRALLRREGKFTGESGKALFRGLTTHCALEELHHHPDELITALIQQASTKVIRQMEDEGRTPTDAVMSNLSELSREIAVVLESYKRIILPITSQWRLIGTELPVFWHLKDLDNGGVMHLSSHIDALFIKENGQAVVWDWKWRKDALAISDLSRNLQLACYFAAICDGSVHIPDYKLMPNWDSDEEGWYWQTGEFPTPQVAWIDLPSLKPYTRKTQAKNDRGEAVTFVKGDDRPLSRVIRNVSHHPEQIENIKQAAIRRGDMLMEGSPIYIPQGCSHCECEPWCPRFDISPKEYYNLNINKESTE
jgi:hypothetical protein